MESLARSEDGSGILQLAEETGLPPSTVHRIMQTLIACGYVTQDDHNGRYRLTGKLLDVAGGALAGQDLKRKAAPIIEQLRDTTGESAHLAVLEGTEAVTILSFLSQARNLVDCPIGDRLPIHCSSVGKCLAAYLPEARLKSVLTQIELPRYTPNTICTVAQLQKNLEEGRKLGFFIDWDERDEGIRCVAAPVRNASGVVIAATGISGPSTRITDDRLEAVAKAVMGAADEMSAALTYPQSCTSAS